MAIKAGDDIRATDFSGMIVMFGGATPPDEWLICDGSAVSRSTYSVLFAILGTTYGPGDGSTTFNLPDLRSSVPLGMGQKVKTFSFATSDVNASTDVITVPSSDLLHTGNAVVLSTSGTVPTLANLTINSFNIDNAGTITGAAVANVAGNGQAFVVDSQSSTNLSPGSKYYVINYVAGTSFQLSTMKGGSVFGAGNSGSGTGHTLGLTSGSTYYIVRQSATAIKLAASRADAMTGTSTALAASGSGTHTLTLTMSNRSMGDVGGEEQHSLTIDELPAHRHRGWFITDGGSSWDANGSQSDDGPNGAYTDYVGSNTPHNVLPPYVVVNYIIKT